MSNEPKPKRWSVVTRDIQGTVIGISYYRSRRGANAEQRRRSQWARRGSFMPPIHRSSVERSGGNRG